MSPVAGAATVYRIKYIDFSSNALTLMCFTNYYVQSRGTRRPTEFCSQLLREGLRFEGLLSH